MADGQRDRAIIVDDTFATSRPSTTQLDGGRYSSMPYDQPAEPETRRYRRAPIAVVLDGTGF